MNPNGEDEGEGDGEGEEEDDDELAVMDRPGVADSDSDSEEGGNEMLKLAKEMKKNAGQVPLTITLTQRRKEEVAPSFASSMAAVSILQGPLVRKEVVKPSPSALFGDDHDKPLNLPKVSSYFFPIFFS